MYIYNIFDNFIFFLIIGKWLPINYFIFYILYIIFYILYFIFFTFSLIRVKFTVGTVVDLQNLSLPGFNSFLTLLFFNFSFITLLQYQYFSPAEREWDEETDKKLLSLLLAHPSRTGPVRDPYGTRTGPVRSKITN